MVDAGGGGIDDAGGGGIDDVGGGGIVDAGFGGNAGGGGPPKPPGVGAGPAEAPMSDAVPAWEAGHHRQASSRWSPWSFHCNSMCRSARPPPSSLVAVQGPRLGL